MRRPMPLMISILTVVIFSAALSIAGLMLGDVMSLQTVTRFLLRPSLFLLNTLPLTCLMVFIFFATSRIWCAFLFGGGVFISIELANRFKMDLRGDALMPSDFILGGEAVKIINLFDFRISIYLAAMLVLFFAAAAAFIVFLKSPGIKATGRVAGALLCLVSFSILFAIFYKDVKRFNTYPVDGNIYSTTDIYRSRGFIYSFLISFETFKMTKPDGYSVNEARKLLEKYETGNVAANQKKPNVIAIMGEAFLDFDRIPNVRFSAGADPLANYHDIISNAYHGKIVTSVFGGGTGSTEFSFLAGHSTTLLPSGITPYKTHIRNAQYSLARFFSGNGYSTTAYHPGYAWFYNRQNVYRFFGFDNIYFKKDMEASSYDTRRGYVTDQDTMEFILEDYQRHYEKNPEVPYFNFTVTIENHGPYNQPAYDEKILERPAGMTDAVYEMVNGYLYGLRKTDQALGHLVSELEMNDEPFVLVFFGDHLPLLNNDYEGYRALGYNIGQDKDVQAFLNHYETPFFIWSNKAARELLKSCGVVVPSGNAPEISTCFLPVELMKYMGMAPPPYFEFLAQLEKSLPVITNYYYKQDGGYVTALSPENQELISQYRKLQHYMMFGNDMPLLDKAAVASH